MYQRIDRGSTQARGYEITSKLSREEAKMLVNELETAINAEGKIRVLFHLKAPAYGDVGAVWEDLKFDIKHLRDMERVAIIGENTLEEAAVKCSTPSRRCRRAFIRIRSLTSMVVADRMSPQRAAHRSAGHGLTRVSATATRRPE